MTGKSEGGQSAQSQCGCEGRNMRKATKKKWHTIIGPLLPSPSFTEQTAEMPATAVKSAKTDVLVAGIITCSHLISA